jgi:hypothetical protein
VLRILSPFKNPTASAGLESANLGTKGQHATPRPPKPLELGVSRWSCSVLLSCCVVAGLGYVVGCIGFRCHMLPGVGE